MWFDKEKKIDQIWVEFWDTIICFFLFLVSIFRLLC